jgi:hypothetical protein
MSGARQVPAWLRVEPRFHASALGGIYYVEDGRGELVFRLKSPASTVFTGVVSRGQWAMEDDNDDEPLLASLYGSSGTTGHAVVSRLIRKILRSAKSRHHLPTSSSHPVPIVRNTAKKNAVVSSPSL